jgi:hypothetical protein
MFGIDERNSYLRVIFPGKNPELRELMSTLNQPIPIRDFIQHLQSKLEVWYDGRKGTSGTALRTFGQLWQKHRNQGISLNDRGYDIEVAFIPECATAKKTTERQEALFFKVEPRPEVRDMEAEERLDDCVPQVLPEYQKVVREQLRRAGDALTNTSETFGIIFGR